MCVRAPMSLMCVLRLSSLGLHFFKRKEGKAANVPLCAWQAPGVGEGGYLSWPHLYVVGLVGSVDPLAWIGGVHTRDAPEGTVF